MYSKNYYSHIVKGKKQNLLFGILTIVILLVCSVISLIFAKKMNEFVCRAVVSTLFVLIGFTAIFMSFKNQVSKTKLNHLIETLNAEKETIVDKVIGVQNDFTLSKYVRVKELFLESGKVIYLNIDEFQETIEIGMKIEATIANNFAIELKVVDE